MATEQQPKPQMFIPTGNIPSLLTIGANVNLLHGLSEHYQLVFVTDLQGDDFEMLKSRMSDWGLYKSPASVAQVPTGGEASYIRQHIQGEDKALTLAA
jgi:hypothetical protein